MTKKPQPNEWWETNAGERVFFACDVSQNGIMVEYPCVVFIRDIGGKPRLLLCSHSRVLESCVKHLPGCTGFDWVEPPAEEFPQYWTTLQEPSEYGAAYILRTDVNEWFIVMHEVIKLRLVDDWHARCWKSKARIRITKEQAEALVPKPVVADPNEERQRHYMAEQLGICPRVEKPAESPDDWVTQDRVPYRREFDECRWLYGDGSHGVWMTGQQGIDYLNGHSSGDWHMEIRCRREDLPPLPELEEVVLEPINSYTVLSGTDRLVRGDILVGNGKAYAVPRQYFRQIARKVTIPGMPHKFFVRPNDPTLVLDTLANMRDQVALLAKRVEKLESMHPTNFAESR